MTQAQNLANLSQAFTAGQFPGKNKIINPCGAINQRGLTSVTQGYSHDRWHFAVSGNYAGKILMTPASNAGGFSEISDHYFYVFCQTQFTGLVAGDYAMVRQFIEGYNAVDLLWGTVFAKPITISFKATGTGLALPFTMGVSVRNADYTRSCVVPVTITASGRYSVTIPGCTDGVWNKTNGVGIELAFAYGSGSTYFTPSPGAWVTGSYIAAAGQSNIATSTTNTVSITDVQLEVGRYATPIEPRTIQQELALAQRYYCKSYNQSDAPGTIAGGSALFNMQPSASWFKIGDVRFPVTMRAVPTITTYGALTGVAGKISYTGNPDADSNVPNPSQYGCAIRTAGGGYAADAWVHWVANAEL